MSIHPLVSVLLLLAAVLGVFVLAFIAVLAWTHDVVFYPLVGAFFVVAGIWFVRVMCRRRGRDG